MTRAHAGVESDRDMARYMQMLPPVPIERVSWIAGWANSVPTSFQTRLAALRLTAMTGLFQRSPSAEQLEEGARAMMEYVNALKGRCASECNADHEFRRCSVLTFSWCFQAQITVNSCGREVATTAKSPLLAFEVLSASVAAIITASNASLEYARQAASSKAQGMFKLTIQMIDDTLRMLPLKQTDKHCIYNRAQWASQCRFGLPLQLQPTWLSYMRASVLHRYNLCAVVMVSKDDVMYEDPDVMLRGAEVTAARVVAAAKFMLINCMYCKRRNGEYVQRMYNNSMAEWSCLRADGLLTDAEVALHENMPAIAMRLMLLSQKHWDCAMAVLEEAAMTEMTHRCETIGDTVHGVWYAEATPEEAMEWRSNLKVRTFDPI